MESDEYEDIYGSNEDSDSNSEDVGIFLGDFVRFTTKKRYIWEDWTVSTREPKHHRENNVEFSSFLLQVILPIVIPGIALLIFLFTIKRLIAKKCCSTESSSRSARSPDRFTTVHSPPRERNHEPGEPARGTLFSEFESNSREDNTATVTITITNPSSPSSSHDGGMSDNAIAEKPPDYTTVILNDLISPNETVFPIVQKGNETPPPEYGQENSFFK